MQNVTDLWRENNLFLINILFIFLIQDVPDLNQTIEWVEPSLEKCDLPKLLKELPNSYHHRLPPSAEEWWKTFMNSISSTYEQVWLNYLYEVACRTDQKASRLSDSLPIKHLMKHLNVFETKIHQACMNI